MSGLVGYIGERGAEAILLNCLKSLDYRGYDSAGIAISNRITIEVRKEEGRIEDLETSLSLEPIQTGTLGIGHTRWASHGKPSIENSHPLSDTEGCFFVVHNGIIENEQTLKKQLREKGHVFTTETDTEVIPHLLAEYDTGSFVETVQKVIPLLKGAFALAIMSKKEPDVIIAISNENPLIVGFQKKEAFLASDIPALFPYTKEIYPIKNGEMAILKPGEVRIQTIEGFEVIPKRVNIKLSEAAFHLMDNDHYMLKEILEQPQAVQRTLDGRLQQNKVVLPELEPFFAQHDLSAIRKIEIIGSGTSFHAGMIGKKILETMVDIPVEASVSSEFRSEHGKLDHHHLVIVISQSGETADTLSALKEAKRYLCPTIAMTNNTRRNIARKADCIIHTHAGPEIAVAATKAYTTHIVAFILLAIVLAERIQGSYCPEISNLIQALHDLPFEIEKSLIMTQDAIGEFAKVTNDQDHLFLIGRGLDYVLAQEGALKLQEVAYLHADAYHAGEMKHGTMALITPGVPVIALSTQMQLRDKTISNIKELKARDAFVVGVTTIGDDDVGEIVDDVLYIPEVHPLLMPVIAAIPLQFLAYYAGTVRGYNVDRPRNLAKSLTVE